jgi:3-hydroxyacyl-[acyl-carrier-protein] dehydratase
MRWTWIDTIVEFEPGRRMAAIKAVTRGEDCLHDHCTVPGGGSVPVMPASLLIEGMAQTAGILVGSVNGFREKVILAKITRAVFSADVYPGQTVRFDATLERIDTSGASTSGRVERLWPGADRREQIGQVDLMFSHVDRNLAGIRFPRENFVFSENFRALLADAGLPAPPREPSPEP